MHQEAFGNTRGLAGVDVGTMHGFGLDLQRYLNESLTCDVLDEARQRLPIDRCYQRLRPNCIAPLAIR